MSGREAGPRDAPAAALAAYRRAVAAGRILPLGEYLQLGGMLYHGNRREDALAVWRAAAAAYPQAADAWLNMGKTLREWGRREEAIAAYRGALAADPGCLAALRNLAKLCIDAGRNEEALAVCRRILELDPGDTGAKGAIADVLELEGRVEEAYRVLRPVVISGPVRPEMALVFGRICQRLEPPPAEAVPIVRRALEDVALPHDQRVPGWRLLGHLHDALDRPREAFECFSKANSLLPLDARQVRENLRFVRWHRAVYTAERLARLPRARHGSELPIFIVGMPRSGTTLAEQILASHPRVFGAGELTRIGQTSLLREQAGASYEDWLDRLDANAVEALAERYLAELRALAPGADRVTDKMPFNFLHLGLIEVLLPRARVIHCVRHPLDTCLSCYFNAFTNAYPFTRDLGAMGAYYRGYAELMRHWREVLTLPIHTLNYEELLAAPERVVRELVAFCGIEWDERCLRFHESRRRVATPSYHQVRKPLYTRSAGRYRAYEPYLGPLKEALGPELLAPAEAT